MIDKLYDLKKTQTDQKISQLGQLQGKIHALDDEINQTNRSIATATVTKHGAISDFSVLQMHKNTMKIHVTKLQNQKNVLVSQVEAVQKEIIELQKETEQFAYILKEEQQALLKKVLMAEEEASSEYMQSKYIKG